MDNQVWVVDRRTRERMVEPTVGSRLMSWLFSRGDSGRSSSLASFIARSPWFSNFAGKLARLRISRWLIPMFIQQHSIHVQDFEMPVEGWAHFEDFFSRRLRRHARAIDSSNHIAVMPADGRYRFFDPLDSQDRLWVKGNSYSLQDLLGNQAPQYHLAPVCVARLCPSDYHRFHSPIEGVVLRIESRPGPLFSVHPWSLRQSFGRLLENKRVLLEIESATLGRCLLIAVGATCVGSMEICVQVGQSVAKGQEIGTFHLGGSSIILIMEPGRWEWCQDLVQLSEEHDGQLEILCQMGQPLAMPL